MSFIAWRDWPLGHCAHGAVEEPEMRIHADEEQRRSQRSTVSDHFESFQLLFFGDEHVGIFFVGLNGLTGFNGLTIYSNLLNPVTKQSLVHIFATFHVAMFFSPFFFPFILVEKKWKKRVCRVCLAGRASGSITEVAPERPAEFMP